ncbi:MAG: hypothetical protein Alpg2KO_14400 [Alphaproteobacteria bacterium]
MPEPTLADRLRFRALQDKGLTSARISGLTGWSVPEIEGLDTPDPWAKALKGRRFEDAGWGEYTKLQAPINRLVNLTGPAFGMGLKQTSSPAAIARPRPDWGFTRTDRNQGYHTRRYRDAGQGWRWICSKLLDALTGQPEPLRIARLPEALPLDVPASRDPFEDWGGLS